MTETVLHHELKKFNKNRRYFFSFNLPKLSTSEPSSESSKLQTKTPTTQSVSFEHEEIRSPPTTSNDKTSKSSLENPPSSFSSGLRRLALSVATPSNVSFHSAFGYTISWYSLPVYIIDTAPFKDSSFHKSENLGKMKKSPETVSTKSQGPIKQSLSKSQPSAHSVAKQTSSQPTQSQSPLSVPPIKTTTTTKQKREQRKSTIVPFHENSPRESSKSPKSYRMSMSGINIKGSSPPPPPPPPIDIRAPIPPPLALENVSTLDSPSKTPLSSSSKTNRGSGKWK